MYVGTNKRLMKTLRVEKKKIFVIMWSSAVRILVYMTTYLCLGNICYLNIWNNRHRTGYWRRDYCFWCIRAESFCFWHLRAYTQFETDIGTGSIILYYYYSDHRSVAGSWSRSIYTYYYTVIARILCIIYRQKSFRLETSFRIFQKTNLRIIWSFAIHIHNNNII